MTWLKWWDIDSKIIVPIVVAAKVLTTPREALVYGSDEQLDLRIDSESGISGHGSYYYEVRLFEALSLYP